MPSWLARASIRAVRELHRVRLSSCSRQVVRTVLAAVVLGAIIVAFGTASMAAIASASSTQVAIIQDNSDLTNPTGALQQFRVLGANTVRLIIPWSLVAPDSNSPKKPNFDAPIRTRTRRAIGYRTTASCSKPRPRASRSISRSAEAPRAGPTARAYRGEGPTRTTPGNPASPTMDNSCRRLRPAMTAASRLASRADRSRPCTSGRSSTSRTSARISDRRRSTAPAWRSGR